MNRLRQMFKTTAVRLTVVYTVLFGLLAIGVVAYISLNTRQLIISQIQTTIDREVKDIASRTRRGGVRSLIPMIERRSHRPGANLYLIADQSGRIIAGNVSRMDRSLLIADGWKTSPFRYVSFDQTGEDIRERLAIARVFTLPGNMRLLVGRDISEAEQFRSIVRRASTISLIIMVLTGLGLWFFVGRRALRHIDSVSRSSERIIAGDLSQRLPLSGSGDEFDRLSTSLNSLIERVERLNTSVTSMSDSIAHDLKTPLTRLRNRAESALGQTDQPPDAVFQEIIVDADGLIRTFSALLMISQVESGARPVKFDTIDFSAVSRDMYELFEPSVGETGAQLELNVDDAVFVRGNRELLSQAVTNLLDNAIKYGGGKCDTDGTNSRIFLRLAQEKCHIVLSVTDNGPGIPEAELENVRGRFVRLEASRNKPGSGLGLSLVEAIVKLHCGKLVLEDANPGLTAKIVLPRAT